MSDLLNAHLTSPFVAQFIGELLPALETPSRSPQRSSPVPSVSVLHSLGSLLCAPNRSPPSSPLRSLGSMSSWRTLLLRVGDKCPEYGGAVDHKEHIETCYGVLWREFEHSKDEISEVGLINLEDEDFGKNIVDDLHCKLQEALSSENCDKIRILLRFLTVLMCSKVILPSSVIEVFETLLSSAATIIDEDAGDDSLIT
ncbi:MIF4G like [Musa troglodytarum]|uniref:MIF4G like n=1 Tax=Musa troglodytarum TaxID=320322 RepID=A0A9E7K4K2_9LILI|nr:MIF4G like [Musa troglodytarum]